MAVRSLFISISDTPLLEYPTNWEAMLDATLHTAAAPAWLYRYFVRRAYNDELISRDWLNHLDSRLDHLILTYTY
jgi:hypothetical protein